MLEKEYIREVAGSDTAVLLIHGIVGTPGHFRDFVPLIPENWSVYNIQLHGHGKKVEDFAAASMEKWKNQVASRTEQILQKHQRLFIAAHSMGTLFAIREAIRHPDRIPKIFLLAVPLRPYLSPAAALSALLISLGLAGPKNKMATEMRNDCGVELDWRLWKYIRWIPRYLELFGEVGQIRKLLPQLSVPTEAYQSKKDEMVLFSTCRDLQKNPVIEMTVLPDSGHFAYAPADLQLLQQRFRAMMEG